MLPFAGLRAYLTDLTHLTDLTFVRSTGKNFLILVLMGCLGAACNSRHETSFLNVSYDPTRELYQEVNETFAPKWQEKTHKRIEMKQSHGGSGKQARAVLEGLEADVLTLALAYDIDVIASKGHLLPTNWQSRLPNNSAPYTSTIVFLVRKGNPKGIKDWDDLIKPGIAVVTPNPRTSGGARWNYLAAWGYALKKNGGSDAKAHEFVSALLKNVAILDPGARGAASTFTQRGIGDVLIAWENEALLSIRETGKGKFDLIVPSISILAEPPVAWVDEVVKKHGTEQLARDYLEFLYTPEGQEIGAKHYFRPRLEAVAKKYESTFPALKLFTVDELFGGWQQAQKTHFSEGGIFDQIQQSNR